MNFTYLNQPPKRYTFEQPKLKSWVERFCHGYTLNLFAGKTTMNVSVEVRVDIDPEMPADYHMDAFDFIYGWKGEKFDTIILDPPYNTRKSREKYQIGEKKYYIGKLTKIKNLIPSIIEPHANIISLGYDSVGMSKSRGFTKIAVCLVCHGGDHNDTIGLVERYE